MELNKIMQV